MNPKHPLSLCALASLLVTLSSVNPTAARPSAQVALGLIQETPATPAFEPSQLMNSLETLNRELFTINQQLTENTSAGQPSFSHRQLKYEEYRNRHIAVASQLKGCGDQLKVFYEQVDSMYRTMPKDPRYTTVHNRYYAALQLYNACLETFKKIQPPEEVQYFAPVFVNTHVREKVKAVSASNKLCLPPSELENANRLLFVGRYDEVDLYLVIMGEQSYYLIAEMPDSSGPATGPNAAVPQQMVLMCSDDFASASIGDAFAFNHLDQILKLNLHQAQLPEDQFNRLMNLFAIAKSYVKPN
ncbi:MAG: hypothetical protein K1Y36_14405 [Blastocatellia bacterium]|nr:hypothetical protein [Blastocatellia bacterium]